MKFYIFCVICLSICFLSCKEDCGNTSSVSFLNVQFYNINTLETDTLAFNSIKGEDIAESLYNNQDTLNTFSLILPSNQEEVTFLFEESTGLTNTLRVNYDRTRFLETRACGLAERIENLNILETTFDSVRVVAPTLNQDTTNINIQIFF